MKAIRIKILFPIIGFSVGVLSLAIFWSSKSAIFDSASSFRDTYEEMILPSRVNNLPEMNTSVYRMMSASTHEKDCTGNQSLPEIIFVAGIEGSGHHLMSVLFDSLAKKGRPRPYDVLGYSPMLNLLEPGDIQSNQNMGFGIIRKRLFRNRLSPLLKKMNEIKKGGGRGMMVPLNSFPMDLSTLTTAQPDLLVLKYFDCVLYRLKIIVTKRHPLLAVTSTVRRFGKQRFALYGKKALKISSSEDITYIIQARITEDQLIYLDQQVRRFSSKQLHFVDIENIFSKQRRPIELKSLSKFLKLNNEETSAFLNAPVRAPVTQINLPPDCANCTNIKYFMSSLETAKTCGR